MPETLQARRKKRYASDPVYRERALKWSRDFKAKRRLETRRGIAQKPAAAAPTWKTIEVELNGAKVSMFTLGALARILGKGLSTLRMWELKGVLPQTPHRSERGDRLYTYDQVASIREQLLRVGKIDPVFAKTRQKPKTITKTVRNDDGVESRVALYRVSALAEVLNKTVSQLVIYEQRGLIPVSPLRAASVQYRLYTPGMLRAVRAVMEMFGYPVLKLSVNPAHVRERILDEWGKMGMRNATIVEDTDAGKVGDGSGGESGITRRKVFGRILRFDASGRRLPDEDAATDGGESGAAVQARQRTGND